jgi:hypothetical protein
MKFDQHYLTTAFRSRWTKIVFVALLVIAGGRYYFLQWEKGWDVNYDADKCEQSIKQNGDPFQLQAWATNLIAQPDGSSNGPVWVANHDHDTFTKLPSCLYGLGISGDKQSVPSLAVMGGTDGEDPYVKLFWGGGMLGHWGMVIGSPTFVPVFFPKTAVVKQWKPGIYFWREQG